MADTVSQNETDMLSPSTQKRQGAAGGKPSKRVVPCDLRRSNQLTGEQVVALTTLHESFARRISDSLGAHLRVAFEMNLVSVEQLTFTEFLARVPDLTYFASLHVMPIDAHAATQLDISLAYPIVDVVLGGSGSDSVDPRDLTEIEEQILDSVFRLILQDMHNAWAPVLDVDFQFGHRQRNVQMQSTMLPGEKILCLTFQAHLLEASGNLTMIFPAVVANTLLRRLTARWSNSERIPSRHIRRRLRECMLDGRFNVDLSLPISRVPVRQLMNLEPGEVVVLPQRVYAPIHLNVAGNPMFLAHPARHGTNRAAKIDKRISLNPVSSQKQE
jgi:flagellar motor switch protein FliM